MKLFNLNIFLVILVVMLNQQGNFAQDSKKIASCQELINYAKETNIDLLNANLQLKLASLSTKTSYANIVNPMIPTSAMAINNIDQQVSFLPGQVFGLPEGTYKQVTMGQQYAFTFNLQPQFDILNLGSIAQVQSAKINAKLVENQNKLNEWEIYNKLNAIYFNIISFNAQANVITEQIINAQKIHAIIANKFEQGITRKQELNEAEVNLISLNDKLEQIKINLEIQFKNLNTLLDNQVKADLTEDLWNYNQNTFVPDVLPNNLMHNNAQLQRELANKELRVIKFQHTPVVSFISSFNWQNLSNDNFFSSNSDWINYSYVGLKIRYDLPTNTQKYANLKTKQIQLELLESNENHIEKEEQNSDQVLALELKKTIAQKNNFEKIMHLRNDTFDKNFNQFEQGILPLDKLLISQNDLIISKLNMISALANVGFTQTKIQINNDL